MLVHVKQIHILLFLPAISVAQSLTEAIAGYPPLSDFNSLLRQTPNLAPLLTSPSQGNSSQNYTVLVPSNKAFDDYRAKYGADITGLPVPDLQAIIKYHILEQALPSAELLTAPPPRLVVPTELTAEQYNNRSAGADIQTAVKNENANGQVVIFKVQSQKGGSKRQNKDISVSSGLYDSSKITILDGTWSHGIFQMIDSFLTLPRQCTTTMRTGNLTALERALNRTQLASTLDHLANVTCIGPTNSAFSQAGDPDKTADSGDLVKALTFHTLTQPVYTNFLKDGQEFRTVSNATVRVTVNATGIWFNDAKLVTENVLTNNGVIQVVDKVSLVKANHPSIITFSTLMYGYQGNVTAPDIFNNPERVVADGIEKCFPITYVIRSITEF
ncbi:hypothetical protein PRK78_004105 [Emydomyces testavorans]|uniref:FAS1 domain-containing protein n=1 Tax=Emydomyces testavorans TaxID=2070801 RepID=A0AAF0DHF5_9EURO|nr:hypothetical protein PRK78_004105 [Emydomyces testavorans]